MQELAGGGVDNNMRPEFLRRQGDTRWNQRRWPRRAGISPTTSSTSESASAFRSSWPPQTRSHRARRRSRATTWRRHAPSTTSRSMPSARATFSRPRVASSRSGLRAHVHHKVYGDRPTRSPCASSTHAGLCRCDLCRWDRRDHEHRSVDALALRRLEGRGRWLTQEYGGTSDANVLSAPEDASPAQSLGRGASWIPELFWFAAISRSGNTRSSDTRESKYATTFIH